MKLALLASLEKGIDPNTPLKDALDFLSQRYDLTFVVDTKAFEAIGVQKAEEQPVQLPRMTGVSLETVLRLLLGQVKGEVHCADLPGARRLHRDYHHLPYRLGTLDTGGPAVRA